MIIEEKPNVPFKERLTELEIYGIEKVLENLLENERIFFHDGVDDFGFCYTSTNGAIGDTYGAYHLTKFVHLDYYSTIYTIESIVVTVNNHLYFILTRPEDITEQYYYLYVDVADYQ